MQEAAREPSKMVSGSPRRCYGCGEPRHIARDCLQKGARDVRMQVEPGTSGTRQGDKEQVRCFCCHQKGHFANKCPTQSVFFSYRVPAGHNGLARAGAVEETPVERVLS